MSEFISMWKNAFDFSGRASRKEYWMAVLFYIIVGIVLTILSMFIKFFGTVYMIYQIAAIIPSLSLSIRRLHDVNKSGWWLLISLTGIGAFYLLYLFCLPSQNMPPMDSTMQPPTNDSSMNPPNPPDMTN